MARKAVNTGLNGFTLSELLIALAILGVIATFTIPKVLQSQQDSKYKAMAKEAAGAVYSAFQSYTFKNGLKSNMTTADLVPYLNYVARDTSSIIDNDPLNSTVDCSNAWEICLKMHNGGMLRLLTGNFGGSATTNAIGFGFDPDGKLTPDGSVDMVSFDLYYDGLITSSANRRNNTYNEWGGPYGPNASQDPAWFSWN